MKQFVLTFFLSALASLLALAQQVPTTTPPASRTTAAARTLTPAEQRQKEKIDREVQRERQIRAEWLQKQRDYEAKQAEKERQRQAKLAGKEQRQRESDQPKAAPPTPTTAAPSATEPAPTASKPSRSDRRQRRQADQPSTQQPPSIDATPAPVAESAAPAVAPTTSAEPARSVGRSERPQRAKREKPSRVRQADTVAVGSNDVETVQMNGSQPNLSRPRREFLPKGHLFEPILLDPLEAQTYGSVLPGYYSEGRKYAGTIVPFAFGFAKPFYRRTTEPGRSEEIVLDLASFTQFEVYHDNQLDKQRRQIMNNDYKVSILYNVRRGLNTYRFRVYHLSSHLGDDYVFRNRITAPTPNPVNYEVLDATYSRVVSDWRLYGGLGVVLRKPAERKTFSAQLGTFYKKPSTQAARLVGGVDLKFWQQTNFRPGIHGGIGVEVGRTANNLTFLVEGYSGFRPYSQYEHQQTAWIGMGVYLNPF